MSYERARAVSQARQWSIMDFKLDEIPAHKTSNVIYVGLASWVGAGYCGATHNSTVHACSTLSTGFLRTLGVNEGVGARRSGELTVLISSVDNLTIFTLSLFLFPFFLFPAHHCPYLAPSCILWNPLPSSSVAAPPAPVVFSPFQLWQFAFDNMFALPQIQCK